jgi:plasmid stability protein
MRITVNIPDQIYRNLKIRAAEEGTTIQAIILESLHQRLRDGEIDEATQRTAFPVIPSKNPGSLQLGHEGVYEYIPFP